MGASEHPDVPVVHLVGKSDSGKTGVVEAVVRYLTGRGWRVGTLKHFRHGGLDTPGKDSWRHAQAGAVSTAVVGDSQYAVYKQTAGTPDEREVIDALGDVDIVIVEGFKGTTGVRVEVVRAERSTAPATDPATLFAMVTDVPELESTGAPVFGLNEGERLAQLIERTFLTAGGT